VIELISWGAVIGLVVVALTGGRRPRVIPWRGTMWGSAEDAQRAHLGHFTPPVATPDEEGMLL
jgi:hypothetical protein